MNEKREDLGGEQAWRKDRERGRGGSISDSGEAEVLDGRQWGCEHYGRKRQRSFRQRDDERGCAR